MMFQYDSYVLEINPVSHIKGVNVGILRGTCKELDFSFTNSSLDTIISEFKNYVNSLPKSMTSLWEVVEHNEQLEQKLEEIVEYIQRGKRRGYKMNFNVSEKLKEIDKQINALLEGQAKLNSQEEKDMTQDKDVVMVNNFVSTIKAVIEEMKSVEETPFLPMIRDLKLKGVYDLYKDIVPVALDQYKDIYDFLLTQEPKKEEESSTLTLNYQYFSSKAYWDNSNCWWYVSHIFDKADKDILKEDAIIGKDIQELQAKFEDYIDKYLVERNK